MKALLHVYKLSILFLFYIICYSDQNLHLNYTPNVSAVVYVGHLLMAVLFSFRFPCLGDITRLRLYEPAIFFNFYVASHFRRSSSFMRNISPMNAQFPVPCISRNVGVFLRLPLFPEVYNSRKFMYNIPVDDTRPNQKAYRGCPRMNYFSEIGYFLFINALFLFVMFRRV